MRGDRGGDGDLYGWDRDDDGADDWLGEQGELDWRSDPRSGEAGGEESSGSATSGSPPRSPGARGRDPLAGRAETVARRRAVAALGVGVVAVIAVIAVVLATSGGGSSTSAPSGVTSAGLPSAQAATPTPQPTTSARPAVSASPQPNPPASTREVTLPSSGMLKLGSSGAEVVALQKALAVLGFKVGRPDGSFGSATEAAVAMFQTAHGLTPDGIVGTVTAKELNHALERG